MPPREKPKDDLSRFAWKMYEAQKDLRKLMDVYKSLADAADEKSLVQTSRMLRGVVTQMEKAMSAVDPHTFTDNLVRVAVEGDVGKTPYGKVVDSRDKYVK